jgi:hypothetical protein
MHTRFLHHHPRPPTCHMPHPYHSSSLDQPNNIWWGVHILKLFIMRAFNTWKLTEHYILIGSNNNEVNSRMWRYMPSWHKGNAEIELYPHSTPTLGGNRQPTPGHISPARRPVQIGQEARWSSGHVCMGPWDLAPIGGSNPGPSTM